MSESEPKHAEGFHDVKAGDVFAMNTPVVPLVLLVMSKDEEAPVDKHGPKVYFRWLAHREPERVTTCEWLYESTLRLKDVWIKVATAT